MSNNPLLAMVLDEIAARKAQAAGGSFVFLDKVIDIDGSEPDGLSEFDRREIEMRQAGALKLGDVLVGVVLVAAPLRDPEQTRSAPLPAFEPTRQNPHQRPLQRHHRPLGRAGLDLVTGLTTGRGEASRESTQDRSQDGENLRSAA